MPSENIFPCLPTRTAQNLSEPEQTDKAALSRDSVALLWKCDVVAYRRYAANISSVLVCLVILRSGDDRIIAASRIGLTWNGGIYHSVLSTPVT